MRRKSITTTALLIAAILCSASLTAACQSRYGANYFPNVPLTTQDGKVVRFYDDLLKGKKVAIDLIYTNCEFSCPLETARLAQVQKALGDRVGKDIFFYSISIDPKRDTPAQLKAYAKKYHAGPGWLFLTGKKSDIDLISKKLGLYAASDINQDGHITSLMIGDEPHGQWMRNSALDNPHFLATTIENFLGPGSLPASPRPSYADAKQLKFGAGQYLFSTRCAACHTIGHGDKIGPDLLGVTNVRQRDWLARFIATPDKLLAARDPIATALYKKYHRVQMPNLKLATSDVDYLIDYLKSQSLPGSAQSTSGSEATHVAAAGGKTEVSN